MTGPLLIRARTAARSVRTIIVGGFAFVFALMAGLALLWCMVKLARIAWDIVRAAWGS